MFRLRVVLGLLALLMAGGCAQAGREKWVASVGGEMTCDARNTRCVEQMIRVARGAEGISPRMHVIDSEMPAAYSWSGGDIYVTRGLVDALSDDQLAAVIAHEMGHLLGERENGWLGLAGSGGSETLLAIEMAADKRGMLLLIKQGIDPAAMRDALDALGKLPNCPGNREQLGRRIAELAGGR